MIRAEMLAAIAEAHTAWSLKHGDSVPYLAADENPHDGQTTDLSIWQADRSAPPEVDDELNRVIVAILADDEEDAPGQASTRALRIADVHPGGEQLKHYWTRDPEGLAKWAFHPHPWTSLRNHLVKFVGPERADRIASEWFRLVFGIWPGERKGINPVGPG